MSLGSNLHMSPSLNTNLLFWTAVYPPVAGANFIPCVTPKFPQCQLLSRLRPSSNSVRRNVPSCCFLSQRLRLLVLSYRGISANAVNRSALIWMSKKWQADGQRGSGRLNTGAGRRREGRTADGWTERIRVGHKSPADRLTAARTS